MPPKTKKTTQATKPAAAPKTQKVAKKDVASKKAAVPAKKGKKGVPVKKVIKKTAPAAPVWEAKPRNFNIGNAIRPAMDVTRFTRWPKYVVMQRKKRVLQQRLKVPPVINQFTKALDTNTAAKVIGLLNKYKPEDKAAKRERLVKMAKMKKGADKGPKPVIVKSGLNHVTKLIEEKKATLVVIAHDVDPVELVMFLPALCRKQDVPFCIVKSKARLGQVVGRKTASCLALTSVKPEDRAQFAQLVDVVKSQYNDQYDETKKTWGGGRIGRKSQAVLDKRLKAAAVDESKRRHYQ